MYPIGSIIAGTLNGVARVLPYLKSVNDEKIRIDEESSKINRKIKSIIRKLKVMTDHEKRILIDEFVTRFKNDDYMLCARFEKLIEAERIVYYTLFEYAFEWTSPLQFLYEYQSGTKLEMI